MQVCIVVLDYNAGKYIDACLQSLLKLEHCNYSVLVIDNASTDGSGKLIAKKYPDFKVIFSDSNLGYAGGNNLGLKFAIENGYGAAWIINPDIVVNKDALSQLVKLAQASERIAAVGSKVYFQAGYEYHKDRYTKKDLGHVIWYGGGKMDWENVYAIHTGMNEVDHGQYDSLVEVDFLTGASMLVKTEVLKKVGLIDEKYFLYYEENDLCQRVRQAGFVLQYCPGSIVWHANAQATVAGSSLVDYYTTRNRMLFGLHWAPLGTKIALIRESIKFLISGRPWQKRGIIDFYLSNFGKGSYAA